MGQLYEGQNSASLVGKGASATPIQWGIGMGNRTHKVTLSEFEEWAHGRATSEKGTSLAFKDLCLVKTTFLLLTALLSGREIPFS